MGATYDVVTQYETTEFLGGTQTRDVVAVGITTKPHGTYLEFRIPRAIYSATQLRDYAIGFSGTVEGVWDIAGVVGMTYSQAPTADGELKDQMTVYVSSTSGNSTLSLVVPFGHLAAALVAPKVAALVTQMDDAEAS